MDTKPKSIRKLAKEDAMTDEEAEQLAEKLVRIWITSDGFSLCHWSYWPPMFRFEAVVGKNVSCQLQQDGTFVLSTNRWVSPNDGEAYAVSMGELRCSPHSSEIASAIANPQREEKQGNFDRFAARWMPRFRRNCWLSGCNIDCTEAERRRWNKWFEQKAPPRPDSEKLSAAQRRQLEWEGRRIAAAFGVRQEPHYHKHDEWMIVFNSRTDDGVMVRWDLGMPFGELYDLNLSRMDRAATAHVRITRFRGYWELSHALWGSNLLDERMARGLYRLGFEEASVLDQLPQLSAHEKMELRLSMPREFWPQTWLDEEI